MNIKPIIHVFLVAMTATAFVACSDTQPESESVQVETAPVTESAVATPGAGDGATTSSEPEEPKQPAGKFVPLKNTLNPESVKGAGKGEQ